MVWPLALACLKVMFGRMLDVPLQTIRMILVVRGKSRFAAMIGFVETFIWFVIVRDAINTEFSSIFIALAYGIGFACGTLIGSFLAKRFINSNVEVQIVTSGRDDEMIHEIRNAGYGVTVVEVSESQHSCGKYMLFIEIQEYQLSELRKLVQKLDSAAFIMVRETKYVHNGYFFKK